MNYREIAGMYPKSGGDLSGFLRQVSPPITAEELSLSLHTVNRESLKIPTTGDFTLGLSYRGRYGFVASMALSESDDLRILQLQGAHGKVGYRLARGVMVPDIFAQEINRIALLLPVRRIVMPNAVEGLASAQSSQAEARYRVLAWKMGLVYSKQDEGFVRDLN